MSISPHIGLRCRCRFHILLRYLLKEDSSATCPSFRTALVLTPVRLSAALKSCIRSADNKRGEQQNGALLTMLTP